VKADDIKAGNFYRFLCGGPEANRRAIIYCRELRKNLTTSTVLGIAIYCSSSPNCKICDCFGKESGWSPDQCSPLDKEVGS
jgi:hypothetical protein